MASMWTAHLPTIASTRQLAHIAQSFRVSTLKPSDFAELLKGRAIRDHLFGKRPSLLDRICLLSQVKHPCRKLDTQIAKVGWSTAFENFDAFDDFQGISNVEAKRLIHVGD